MAKSDAPRANRHDSKSLMSRLINSLPTSSRYCPKRAGVFACLGVCVPWRKARHLPFCPCQVSQMVTLALASAKAAPKESGLFKPKTVFASDGLHKEYAASA
jgi:hypothetical protein